MGTTCQQCGGKGFDNAFVYCVTCLNFAVHRYCLPKLPKTFDEFVRWHCEDCEPKSIKHSPSKKPSSIPSKKMDNLISKGVRLKKCTKLKGKENNVAPLVTETEEQRCQISPWQRTSEAQTELALCVDQNITMQHLVAETEGQICQTSPSQQSCEAKTELAENYENDLELVEGRKLTVEGGSEFGEEAGLDRIDDFQTAAGNLSNTLEQNYHLHAKPATDRIWRGSFSICTKFFAIFDGIVAHLSSTACQKVCEEAALLPAVLRLEMLSKSTIWPDSFQKLEPCYEHINLYFFAESQWYEWVFDCLVDDMIEQELAMRAIVKNGELLVFPSSELSIQYSKHQGKYYLCGVFLEKQDSSFHLLGSNPANGMVTEEQSNLRRSKSCDPRSPQSPLSNNCSLGSGCDKSVQHGG